MVRINPTPSYYNDEQLVAYLLHIGLPSESVINDKPSLDNAETLIRHHITTIPFENTQMHYTASGFLDTDPQIVYTRIIGEKKGGSHCHGLHFLLLGMMLKLGYRWACSPIFSPPIEALTLQSLFRGYFAMARLNQLRGPPELVNLGPLDHQVLVIQIPGDENMYFVDIGYSVGVARPARLAVGHEFDGIAGKKYRFARACHPDSPLSGEEGEEWALMANMEFDWKPVGGPGWRTVMQFSTQPYFLKDLMNFNWMVNHDPKNGLHKGVFVQIYTRSEQGALVGQKNIWPWSRDVTLRTATGLEVVQGFTDEEGRIAALKDQFGIECPTDAIVCISSRPSAVKVAELGSAGFDALFSPVEQK
ncbi:N-terminal acetyltransferase [Tulasnella sp. 330]|nr:N-terminal acetyltransferase [Tulasnella sp. 330]